LPTSTVRLLRLVGWVCTCALIFLILAGYVVSSGHGANAVQQAGFAADQCVYIIGLYALARGADAILGAIERPNRRTG
jgi:hypothetical protein